MKKSLVFIIVAAIGLAGGYALNQYLLDKPAAEAEQASASAVSRQVLRRPEFVMLDTEGKPRNISEWDGQVILLNFWATWCPPCRKEMPAFVQLYEKYKDRGFTIIGVAIDEKQAVVDFIDPMGVDYPVLIGDRDGLTLTREYGNRIGVLPYTVIINRKGEIVEQIRHELSYEQTEALILPLLGANPGK